MKGAWNKARSDFCCNVKFFMRLIIEYKVIWKENLAIYQKSLIRAFFQAPLQMKKLLTSGCTLMYCSMASSDVLQI